VNWLLVVSCWCFGAACFCLGFWLGRRTPRPELELVSDLQARRALMHMTIFGDMPSGRA
jgi:hypothetical protein